LEKGALEKEARRGKSCVPGGRKRSGTWFKWRRELKRGGKHSASPLKYERGMNLGVVSD
jgi:hypothetical protein